MVDIELIAQVRAFPSRGRARINTSDLASITAGDEEIVGITNPGTGKAIEIRVFSDDMVEKGHIRLSKEDLDSLGASEGDRLITGKAPELGVKIKKSTDEIMKNIDTGINAMGDSIGKAIDPGIKQIDGAFKKGADSVSGAIGSIPVPDQISALVESAKKKLGPSDAAQLAKVLKENSGGIRAVVVAPGTPVRMLSSIAMPSGVIVIVVQRGDDVLIQSPSLAILAGDTVYLAGKDPGLSEAIEVIRS